MNLVFWTYGEMNRRAMVVVLKIINSLLYFISWANPGFACGLIKVFNCLFVVTN